MTSKEKVDRISYKGKERLSKQFPYKRYPLVIFGGPAKLGMEMSLPPFSMAIFPSFQKFHCF
jgi:hypothetical protein